MFNQHDLWSTTRRAGARCVAIGLCAFSLAAAAAVVPTPVVTGPLPGSTPGSADRNYPYFSTHIVLSDYGYVEQEFFFDGTANTYDAANPGGVGNTATPAPTANILTTGNPYRSRMLVRRPVDPARFNGVVIVEWFNVTNGWDLDVHWQEQMQFYIREGYAYVGVSAQNAGVSNSPNGLKVWSPLRYSTMNVNNGGTVTQDRLSYDIFAQAAQAVRSVPAVLGGLPVQQVLAVGESQSAGRLSVYVNAVHVRDPIYDGAIITHGGQRMRTDLTIPVFKVLSETEHTSQTNEIPVLQPDTDKIRIWAVAGTSHSEYYTMILRAPILLRDLNQQAFDTCATPARSRVPFYYVLNTATDALVKWIRNGTEPAHGPAMQMATTTPPVPARDARGNALGGIRLAEMEVPVAKNAADTCGLGGTHVMFDTATLNALYPTQADYVTKVMRAANASVAAGFVLLPDAKLTMTRAMTSQYGLGLDCAYLCMDQDAFPIHPSASLLRDQTELLHFIGYQGPLSRMVLATRAIGKGYALGSAPAARQSFAEAVGHLQLYIGDIQSILAAGHLKPETASLLVAQANTLIQRVNAL